jgi:hypothetical protein
VIKEADKGNAVVILDREYYRDNILDMLKDRMYYEETDKKADQKTYKMITKLLHEHEGELHKEEIDYITNFTFTESYFYGLPKVHKSEVISNAILEQHTEYINIINPDDLKFRPIVGGPNCITQRLSHFIDIILKPLCCEVPSFIRDDLEFLNHLRSHCGSSFLSVKLTVKIENISFKNNFHGFKNKIFRKAILYNVSFIFQPKCYCRNSQIVRNICRKTYNIKTGEFRIWIYGRRQMI